MRPSIGFWIKCSTGLVASVVILTQSLQAREYRAAAQGMQPPPAVLVPVPATPNILNLGLMTVVAELPYFAGQHIRMVDVRVREVLSPRLFTIEPARSLWSSRLERYDADSRALVVLGSPTATPLRRGVVLEVVGEPWTLFEAEARHDPGGLSELGPRDARRFARKPVIHATLVRTPGGVELYAAR